MQPTEKQFLNIYFQVHQPRRLKKYQFFDIGSDAAYFDGELNRDIFRRIAEACYLPANRMLLRLIEKLPDIRVTFSISGVALEQMQRFSPEVMSSFRQLAQTGSVEFLAETYYHSLAYFINYDEFTKQVAKHVSKMDELLGVRPAVFRNTELIYSDGIGQAVADLGFKGIYIDGIQEVLNGRTPNALYKHPEEELVLFPRNFQLSDDIAFRFSDTNWSEWPLSGKKFTGWLSRIPKRERFVMLGMDYETFGEHKKANSGIFAFFEELVTELIRARQFTFINPSEVMQDIRPAKIISSDRAISWADEARDLSAWLGNDMQRDAFDSLYRLHDLILESGDVLLRNSYRYLQTSDHFYYMATKGGADGNVHQYFSPYKSPYEAFMNFMNVITDLELKAVRAIQKKVDIVSFDSDRRVTSRQVKMK